MFGVAKNAGPVVTGRIPRGAFNNLIGLLNLSWRPNASDRLPLPEIPLQALNNPGFSSCVPKTLNSEASVPLRASGSRNLPELQSSNCGDTSGLPTEGCLLSMTAAWGLYTGLNQLAGLASGCRI